jgi:hypothetical protein
MMTPYKLLAPVIHLSNKAKALDPTVVPEDLYVTVEQYLGDKVYYFIYNSNFSCIKCTAPVHCEDGKYSSFIKTIEKFCEKHNLDYEIEMEEFSRYTFISHLRS